MGQLCCIANNQGGSASRRRRRRPQQPSAANHQSRTAAYCDAAAQELFGTAASMMDSSSSSSTQTSSTAAQLSTAPTTNWDAFKSLEKLHELEGKECVITLQPYKELVKKDLLVSWCCRACMSGSAVKKWITEYGGEQCPNCRSCALPIQAMGPKPDFLNGAHVLHVLVAEGRNNAIIDEVIASQPDQVSANDGSGQTPLQYAIANGHERIVQLLCEANSDINHVSNDGSFPLLQAAKAGRPDIIRVLLHSGNEEVQLWKEVITELRSPNSSYYNALGEAKCKEMIRILQSSE